MYERFLLEVNSCTNVRARNPLAPTDNK